MATMKNEKSQNILGFLILFAPITLFFFIKWYWVLLLYNILFSIFGYVTWKASKKHIGLFKAIVFPLLFNVIGLLYIIYINYPDEEKKEKKTDENSLENSSIEIENDSNIIENEIDEEEVEKNLAMNVAKILAMNPNSEHRINFSFNEEWKSCYYQYKTNSKLNPNNLPTLDEKYLGDTGEPLLNDNNQEVYDPSQKIEYKTYFKVKQKEVYTSKSIISLLQEKIKEKLESGELSKNSNQEELLQSLGVYDICPESSVLLFKAIGCNDYKKLESKNEYDNILWCTSTQLDEEYIIFSLEEISDKKEKESLDKDRIVSVKVLGAHIFTQFKNLEDNKLDYELLELKNETYILNSAIDSYLEDAIKLCNETPYMNVREYSINDNNNNLIGYALSYIGYKCEIPNSRISSLYVTNDIETLLIFDSNGISRENVLKDGDLRKELINNYHEGNKFLQNEDLFVFVEDLFAGGDSPFFDLDEEEINIINEPTTKTNSSKYEFSDVKILKKQLLEFKPQIRYEMGWDNYFVIQLKNNVLVDELDLVECDGDDETVKLAISEFVDFSEEIAPDKNKKFYKGRITLFETRIQNYDSLIVLIDNFLEETNEFSYDDFMNWYLDYSADNIFMGETSKLMVGETNISADKFFSFAKTQFGDYESIHKMDINIESIKNDNEQSNQEKIKNFSEFKTAIKSKLNSNEGIDIDFYMYKYDVIEKLETYGENWRGIDYTLSWDEIIKNAELSFAEGITDFYEIIKHFSSLDELNGDDFHLNFISDYGAHPENFKVVWQRELSDEESKQFEEYGGVNQLHKDSDGGDSIEMVKGRISRIVVKIGDNENIEISA